MKHTIYIVALLFATTLTAQKIKLKKEVVYADDAAVFSFEKKAMGNEVYIYKLNTKEELLNIVVENNGTESKVDDSKKVVFGKQNITIVSKDFRGWTYEFLIEQLLIAKAINLSGEINTDNLNQFKAKYDDGNINHTNKH